MPATRTRRGAALAASVSAVALLAACGGAAEGAGGDGEPIELTYAFYAPETTHAGAQMVEWAKQVEERTDGQVQVKTFPGGTLLGTGDIFDGVTEGVVDVGLDSPHNDEGRFPLSSVMGLPLGIPDAQVGSKVYHELLGEFTPREFEGYKVLTAFTAEPSFVQTVEEVRSTADLRGMELRVSGQNVELAQDLGASPVGMPIPEVAEALQTGVVSGYISSRDVLKDFGLGEMVNYVVDYPLGLAGTFVAVMDEEDYAALPDDVKAVVDELGAEMSAYAARYQDEESVATSVAWAETEHGLTTVTLDDAERAVWDETAEAAIQAWVDEHDGVDFDAQAVLDRARELVAEHTAQS